MKCLSTSTCLVLSCCTGLCAMFIVDLLSQYSFIGPFHSIFRSSRIIFIHRSSQIPKAIAQNSASALDLAIMFLFFCSSKLLSFLQEKCNIRRWIFYHLQIQHSQHLYRPPKSFPPPF